jgi:hypothetical protein
MNSSRGATLRIAARSDSFTKRRRTSTPVSRRVLRVVKSIPSSTSAPCPTFQQVLFRRSSRSWREPWPGEFSSHSVSDARGRMLADRAPIHRRSNDCSRAGSVSNRSQFGKSSMTRHRDHRSRSRHSSSRSSFARFPGSTDHRDSRLAAPHPGTLTVMEAWVAEFGKHSSGRRESPARFARQSAVRAHRTLSESKTRDSILYRRPSRSCACASTSRGRTSQVDLFPEEAFGSILPARPRDALQLWDVGARNTPRIGSARRAAPGRTGLLQGSSTRQGARSPRPVSTRAKRCSRWNPSRRSQASDWLEEYYTLPHKIQLRRSRRPRAGGCGALERLRGRAVTRRARFSAYDRRLPRRRTGFT